MKPSRQDRKIGYIGGSKGTKVDSLYWNQYDPVLACVICYIGLNIWLIYIAYK